MKKSLSEKKYGSEGKKRKSDDVQQENECPLMKKATL